MNWTKQYPGWTMFGAMVGLLIFLWGLAIPLSLAPEPIGPAANEFAAGARITVLLTLISGTSGIVGTSSKSGATKDAAGTGGARSANDNLPSRAVFRVPCG